MLTSDMRTEYEIYLLDLLHTSSPLATRAWSPFVSCTASSDRRTLNISLTSITGVYAWPSALTDTLRLPLSQSLL